jgi:Histidine kinase-, DNA gyrase B-, and HSP90-like ATPase
MQKASAKPRKRFFVEMFTRDISLQDCILDLIDNSIDAYIRQSKMDLLTDLLANAAAPKHPAQINVQVSSASVRVDDNCGGIDIEKAKSEVFNFGHSAAGVHQLTNRGLGAYGIGLKRALFKIGESFSIESHTKTSGFRVQQDLREWLTNDEKIEDWTFPLEVLAPSKAEHRGTVVEVKEIPKDLKQLLDNPDFIELLEREIARAYSMFLANHVNISLNGKPVEGLPIPLAEKVDGSQPASERWNEDSVQILLRAGLAELDQSGRWAMDRAGWYVLCNGRVVVSADKTELTGWGAGVLPQFHSSKSRGFVGIALFYSSEPTALPWTTTKRGLNRESPIYLRTRQKMQSIARPVYTYLDSLYKKNSADDGVAPVSVRGTASKEPVSRADTHVPFRAPRRKSKSTSKVQYDATRAELEQVRKHLRQAGMPANKIGRHTFDYFLEQEGLS